VTATDHNLSGEIRHTSPGFRFVRQIEPDPPGSNIPIAQMYHAGILSNLPKAGTPIEKCNAT
jgi:hypothetical protein